MKRRELARLLGAAAAAAAGGYLAMRYTTPREARRGRRMRATVAVVGAGVAGSTAAASLWPHADVLVVEPASVYVVGPAKEDLLLGLPADDYVAPIWGPVLRAAAIGVNPAERELYTTAGVVEYRYLVLAPGVRLAYERVAVRGPLKNLDMYDGYAALAHRGAARGLRGRIVVVHPGLPYRCTSAPYEFAFLVDSLAGGPHEVTVVSGVKSVPAEFEGHISPLGGLVARLMEERGMALVGGAEAVEVDAERGTLVLDNGEVLRFDHLSLSPPQEGWPWLVEAGLSREDLRGYVRVGDDMRTRWDDVYAVGDVVWHVVKTGWAAHVEAKVAAAAILNDMGMPAEAPRQLYSEDAMRMAPHLAVRAAKAWWPIYGQVSWRTLEGPSEEAAAAKRAWMRAMRDMVAGLASLGPTRR